MSVYTDLRRRVFGRLTVLCESPDNVGWRNRKWLCRCSCGVIHETLGASLTSGRTISCGCFRKEVSAERSRSHGMCKSRTYVSWNAMWQRCTNPTRKAYKYYGGKGITICDRWQKFENFLEDMGERPANRTLERKNGELGYTPENCMWATSAEQSASRACIRYMTAHGKTLSLADWAKELGYSYSGLFRRLERLPEAKALAYKTDRGNS